ncbi:MAG: hypothetical protein GC190_14870 [Alphaproteobacteria bacterium]|nr:hypothetical protein [Alphaproteobacteria bacterium]
MNTFASVAFGAAALTAASVGLAEPASARTNVGVYISPYGIGVSLNPNYCSDYRFRRDHWDYCARYYGSYGYWPNFGGYYGDYRVRHYDNRRHRDHENHWRGNEHRGNHRDGDHRHH